MKTRVALAAALSVLLLTTACGEEARDVSGGTEGGTFPVTVTAANGAIRIPERPEKIVSLSPTATEMLFAIDAGEQVDAVDSESNYPTDAPKTDLSGFQPNAEAVAQREPDLVVLSDDINEIVKSLQALNIPVLQMPAAQELGDSYE